MGLRAKLLTALLGVSAYEAPPNGALPSLDDAGVQRLRENFGGQLALPPQTRTRWYQADIETATLQADGNGDLSLAAQLWRSCKRDGVFAGVLSTRTGGLVRLPKKFRGRPDIVAALREGSGFKSRSKKTGKSRPRSVFEEIFPTAELALLAGDGIGLGVGVAEMVPVQGRDYPVMVRLDPQWLVYRWYENRWYYRSAVGFIAITPGDGRWLLHIPGGRLQPWNNGIWPAVGRAFIDKQHALLYSSNWQSKLAHPARVAVSPQGASQAQEEAWFKRVMAWGVNTVFGMKPGYDVKLLESNGRGYESFDARVEHSEREMIIAVSGQTVTTDGGAGFQNSDIHKAIRSDLIQETGDALAFTLNTQGIPPWVQKRFGNDALDECALVEWVTASPKELAASAQTLGVLGPAIKGLREELKEHGVKLDIGAICVEYGIPIEGDVDGDGLPDQDAEIPDDEEPIDAEDLDSSASNDNAEEDAA